MFELNVIVNIRVFSIQNGPYNSGIWPISKKLPENGLNAFINRLSTSSVVTSKYY